MTHTTVNTETRPNTDTAWYQPSEAKVTFMSGQTAAGNRISKDMSISENELIRTTTVVWKDEDAHTVVKNNSIITTHGQARKTYNGANGITGEKTVL